MDETTKAQKPLLRVTIRRQNKVDVVAYFENEAHVKVFHEFIKDLVEEVKNKTAEGLRNG